MKAVIFDNDGVLVNSEETAIIHDPPFIAQYDLHFTMEEYARLIAGKTRADFIKAVDEEAWKRLNRTLPADFHERLQQFHAYQVKNLLEQVEGVGAFIDKLKRSNTPIAIASNGEHEAMKRKLEKTGLRSAFMPHIYNKDDVGGKGKPAPDMLLHAMKKLGINDPKQCFYIDDTATGIKAAVAADMDAIGYSGGVHRDRKYHHELYAAGANFVAYDMSEIEKHVIARLVP